LSQRSKREVIERRGRQYLHSGRKEKSRILDALQELTGDHRKSLVRALRQGYMQRADRRGCPRAYGSETLRQLVKVWRIYDGIWGKRLQPFLAEGIKVLEGHQELILGKATRAARRQMSAATIDRYLKPYRTTGRRGLTTTRSGQLLKINYFPPVRKLINKEWRGATIYKKYDQAQTPRQRLMNSADIKKQDKLRLHQLYLTLNPAGLQRHIEETLKELWFLAE